MTCAAQGLLFKVNGVDVTATAYNFLSGVMLTLCGLFLVSWLSVVLGSMATQLKRSPRRRAQPATVAGARLDNRAPTDVAARVGAVEFFMTNPLRKGLDRGRIPSAPPAALAGGCEPEGAAVLHTAVPVHVPAQSQVPDNVE